VSPGGREKPCAPPALERGLAAAVEGYTWARDTVGEAGADVFRLHGKAGAPELYLKHGADAAADDVADEAARLCWLSGRLPTPSVVHFTRTSDAAWLLMTAMPGLTAYQALEAAAPDARFAIVDSLADFLRQFHAIPEDDCPFNSALPYRLAQARRRIDAGLVDADDFDDVRDGWTAEQVWDAIHALRPIADDAVVTHGDFSLDNILMGDSGVSGCIDAGRVGVADRYQDLAILWNCLDEFDPALQDRLFVRYGLPLDRRRLDLHLMVDELF
jgi:aminoglycoside 3'-phosphotransferase-1